MSQNSYVSDELNKRIKKLQGLRTKLQAEQAVGNRELRRWLGEYFERIAQQWDEELAMRLNRKDKPTTIKRYEALLKQADFQYGKANSAVARGSRSAAAMMARSTVLYERALEYLQEQVGMDSALELWLDRSTDNSPHTVGTSIDFHGMPRVRTSRSTCNTSAASVTGSTRTKREIKIAVVEQAIAELSTPPASAQQQQLAADRLKQLLRSVKSQ